MAPISKESLQFLPLRGIVFFAALCSRRVQPVYNEWNREVAAGRHVRAVEAAIQLAEDFAHGVKEPDAICCGSDAIAPAAMAAADATSRNITYYEYHAAVAAAFAAYAVVGACFSLRGLNPSFLGRAAVSCAYETEHRMLLALESSSDQAHALRASVEDYTYLLGLDLGEFPEIGKVVPHQDRMLCPDLIPVTVTREPCGA